MAVDLIPLDAEEGDLRCEVAKVGIGFSVA